MLNMFTNNFIKNTNEQYLKVFMYYQRRFPNPYECGLMV